MILVTVRTITIMSLYIGLSLVLVIVRAYIPKSIELNPAIMKLNLSNSVGPW